VKWLAYLTASVILFDSAATSGIGLQRPALTNADWLHWLTCYIFTRESRPRKQLLLSSHLSHHNSVRPSVCLSIRPSVTWVDQSKAVQARITKFSLLAARNYRYAIQIENLVFVY